MARQRVTEGAKVKPLAAGTPAGEVFLWAREQAAYPRAGHLRVG